MDANGVGCAFVVLAYLLLRRVARIIDGYNISKGNKVTKSRDKTVLSESEIERLIGPDKVKIGSGAFGIVFKIEYNGSLACLKMGKKADQPKMFMLEAAKLRKANGAGGSPKLLAVANDAPMMVTTFCPGQTISEWLKSNPRLPPKLVLTAILEIAAALDDLHSKGLVHNDIKKDNILVEYTDEGIIIHIIDLGLASISGSPKLFIDPTPARYKKYPWYAPEVWFGLTTDPKSDVYSLGHLAAKMIKKTTIGDDLMDHGITMLVDQMQQSEMGMRPTVPQVISSLRSIIDSCDDP